MSLWKKVTGLEGRIRAHYNVDPDIPGNERRAWVYNNFFDHAFLRTVWTNFYEIAPGVYRSNQPGHARLEKIRDRGITTVLTLRGKSEAAHYLTEAQSCRKLGLTLEATSLHARSAATREELLALLDLFDRIERPFVMHCKSGADRAGLASAIWLMVKEGKPVHEARKMLGPKYWHFPHTKVGVLDYMLDCYAARLKRGPISFREWVETEYDWNQIQTGFDNRTPPA